MQAEQKEGYTSTRKSDNIEAITTSIIHMIQDVQLKRVLPHL